MDLANGKLSFGVLFNETLTRGMDLTFLINFITNAMWRHITNNANAYLTAGMSFTLYSVMAKQIVLINDLFASWNQKFPNTT